MPNIFISYRREDSDIWVGRLVDELRKHFVHEEIFQDIASIDPGAEFPKVLTEALATATAMLVVIGPRWLSVTDRQGRRRLDNASDFVRQEIVESLRRPGVRVFPVLVGGAEMPTEDDLPDPLKPLVQRHAFDLTVRHWARDAEQLVQILKRVPRIGGNRAMEADVPPGPIGQPMGSEESTPNEEAQRRPAEENSAAEEQRRLAEEESRRQAEAEAKRLAEAESRRRAEAEAKRLEEQRQLAAEAQSRRQAEAETKRLEEAESRRREEAEAQRPASEQEKNQQQAEITPTASATPTWPSAARWKQLAVIAGIGALVLLLVIKGLSFVDKGPAPKAMTVRAQSSFSKEMRHHSALLDVAREIHNTTATTGVVRMEALAAGAVVPVLEVVDAVHKKVLDAGWIYPQYVLSADSAFALVQGSPFGLDTENYIAWRENREVGQIVDRLYRQRGVVGLLCGVTGPQGDIWAKKPIVKAGDFQGLKIRASGAYIPLFTKLGAAQVALPGGEIVPAMERGVLDAVTFLDPATDLILGITDVSKVYMVAELSGAMGLDLVINAVIWDQWQPHVRDAVAAVCKTNARKMAAENGKIAANAIEDMKKREVRIYRMPQSVLAAMQKAWNEVRAEYAASSPAFAELAASMKAYETARERPNLSTYGLK